MVYPGSHTVNFSLPKNGYHVLSADEMRHLADQGCQQTLIPANVGDTLIMQGGLVVHGSVAVPSRGAPRFAAYAHFALP